MEKPKLYHQTALAQALGVTRQTIHRWERDNKIIRFGTGWPDPTRGWSEAEVEILRQWQAGEIGHAEMYAAQAKARSDAILEVEVHQMIYDMRGHMIRLLFPDFGPGATEAEENEVFDRISAILDPANQPSDEVIDAQMAIEEARHPAGTPDALICAHVVLSLDAKRAAADLL